MDDIIYQSAKSIASAVREKTVAAVGVVEAHLRRIEEVNPKLNAVVLLAGDRALAEARQADAPLAGGKAVGPLHGVPMTIKDSLDTEGVVTTGARKAELASSPSRTRLSSPGYGRQGPFCWARPTPRSSRWRARPIIWSTAGRTIPTT